MSTTVSVHTTAAKRLATLAVLRAHWTAGKETYVDTFLPFALEAVRLEGGIEVSLDAIRTRMTAEFGMEIPTAAVETILRGAAKKGSGNVRGRSFIPDPDGLGAFDTAQARQTAQREQVSLIERVVEAAAEQGLTWSDDEAAEAIADYLDRHATSLLAATHGQDLPASDSDGEADPREFVVASLFAVILEREPEAAAHVERLVVGTMLASALYTPELEKLMDPLCCDVYLDSPILIDALGHAGTIPAKAARESITLLREAGASVKCFEHSAAEVERKLDDVAQQLRNPRRIPHGTDTIIQNATQRNLTPADLEQSVAAVRRQVKALGVEVVEAPPHTRRTTIDEVLAERVLEKRLGHSRKSSIQFDLDSLSAVHRIRGGQKKYRIETCGAIFVTPHWRLIMAAREIFPVGRKNAPVAVALADLVTLAWLKKPRAVPDLPRLRIAADCYATIQPPAGVVRRYVEEATKLHAQGAITDDDLYELRYGPESRRILMVKTKGDAGAVTPTVVNDILAERDRQIAAKATRQAEREANAARAELDQERATRAEEAVEFSNRIEKLERHAEWQEAELRRARTAELAAINSRTHRQARWLVRPAALILFAAAVLIVLFTFPFVGDRIAAPIGLHVLSTLPHAVAWAVRAAAIAIAALLVVLNMWGWGFGHGMSKVERWVQVRLERRALRRSHWNSPSSSF
jgi:hypothetical protein